MKYRLLLVVAALSLALVVPASSGAHSTGSHSHCTHLHAGSNWEGHYRWGSPSRCYYLHGHASFPANAGPRNSSGTIRGGVDGPSGVEALVGLFSLLGLAGLGGAFVERRRRFGSSS